MSTEPRPAFPFYVRDWRSSLKVQKMTFDERGRYLELLLEQWDKGVIPSSATACAKLIGGSEAGWKRAWPALAPHFVARRRDGLLVNKKLEGIRRQQQEYQKAQALSGLKGAKVRWKRHGKPIGSPSEKIGSPSKPIGAPNATPMAKRMANDSLALASSLAIASASALALASSDDSKTSKSKSPDEFLTTFKALFQQHRGQPYRPRTNDRDKLIGLLAEYGVDDLTSMAQVLLTLPSTVDEWIASSDRSIAVLAHKAALLLELAGTHRAAASGVEWGAVLERLEGKLPRNEFHQWLAPTRQVECVGDVLSVSVDSDEQRRWVQRNYATQLDAALTEAGIGVSRVEFVVRDRSH